LKKGEKFGGDLLLNIREAGGSFHISELLELGSHQGFASRERAYSLTPNARQGKKYDSSNLQVQMPGSELAFPSIAVPSSPFWDPDFDFRDL
jgi:hypothetical protein